MSIFYCFHILFTILFFFFFLMIRRPPRSTLSSSSAASDVYKRQTLYHSADHHYTDKYLACSGISETLKTDFRVMRLCLVAGYRWIGFKFLCKQYCEEDAVCKILYEIAMKHDPELAEGILTIGISI
eukprot:TRINITY_DN6222_c0_g1_i4.p1 TRINITY_DN6222_c0_g1~~TRINITY_DN6222_c0_g1_i4.p1  ORF type:complete len:127 (-),score=41.01 TRINITY_DN6222_c0_g1_i4:982-1362(-)